MIRDLTNFKLPNLLDHDAAAAVDEVSLEALEHGVEQDEMKEKARSNHTETNNTEAVSAIVKSHF